MIASVTTIRLLAALALAATLAGCNDRRDPGFQGWVEADMIFVSPDESGRVTKLLVREGDQVKAGDQIYSVDDDLQQAEQHQQGGEGAHQQHGRQIAEQDAAHQRTGGAAPRPRPGVTARSGLRLRSATAGMAPV